MSGRFSYPDEAGNSYRSATEKTCSALRRSLFASPLRTLSVAYIIARLGKKALERSSEYRADMGDQKLKGAEKLTDTELADVKVSGVGGDNGGPEIRLMRECIGVSWMSFTQRSEPRHGNSEEFKDHAIEVVGRQSINGSRVMGASDPEAWSSAVGSTPSATLIHPPAAPPQLRCIGFPRTAVYKVEVKEMPRVGEDIRSSFCAGRASYLEPKLLNRKDIERTKQFYEQIFRLRCTGIAMELVETEETQHTTKDANAEAGNEAESTRKGVDLSDLSPTIFLNVAVRGKSIFFRCPSLLFQVVLSRPFEFTGKVRENMRKTAQRGDKILCRGGTILQNLAQSQIDSLAPGKEGEAFKEVTHEARRPETEAGGEGGEE